MPSKVIELNLARGFDQSIDPRIAPQGTILRTENVRIRKDGRLGVRNGYEAIPMDTYNATLAPRDLIKYNNNLVCLGNSSGSGSFQIGIRSAYEYVNNDAGTWRTSNELTTSGMINICAADSMELVVSNIFTSNATVTTDCAFGDGVVCLITSDETLTLETVHIHFINADTGQTQFYFQLGGVIRGKVLFQNGKFLIFAANTSTGAISVRAFDVNTDTNIPAGTTLSSTLISPYNYDVSNYGTTDFLISWCATGVIRWRRYNTSFVQQTTTDIVVVNPAASSIEGTTVTGKVNVAYIAATSGNAGPATLQTFTASSGATSGSAQSLFGGDRIVALSVTRRGVGASATTTVMVTGFDTQSSNVQKNLRTETTQVDGGTSTIKNVQLESKLVDVQSGNDSVGFCWLTLGDSGSNEGFGLFAFESEVMNAALFHPIADSTVTGQLSSIVLGSNSWYYWPVRTREPNGTRRVHLCRFRIFSSERRQAVQHGANLYISGALVTQYDSQVSTEVGFLNTPRIISLSSSNSTGNLTPGGTYQYFTVFRYVDRWGDETKSEPSLVGTIKLGASDNTVTFSSNYPYTARTASSYNEYGGKVLVDVYRTEAGGSIPRLSQSAVVVGTFGADVAITDTNSDTTIQSGRTLYTQGESGSTSGRRPLSSPEPAKYIFSVDGRLVLSGLPRAFEGQLSEEPRPGESTGFVNDDLPFFKIPGHISAAAELDGNKIFFTEEGEIWLVEGTGVNSAGNQGGLSEPRRLPSQVGCKDWRSVVVTEFGTFFQGDDDKLYLIPRGALAPVWAGQGIRDLLTSYPHISSATKHIGDNLVTFTLQNGTLGTATDSRIVHLDVRTSGFGPNGFNGNWIVDRLSPETTSTGWIASCEYQDNLVVCNRAAIYKVGTTFTDPSSAFIVPLVETCTLFPMGVGGDGRILSIIFVGEYRGNCVLNCFVSYDDGQSYTTLTPFDITGLTVGDTVRRQWVPARFKGEGFRVKITATEYNSSGPSESLIFQKLSIRFAGTIQPTRLPSASRN